MIERRAASDELHLVDVVDEHRTGDGLGATALHLQLLPLHKLLFCEPSPAPTKWAMARLGLCGAQLRLPIVALTDAGQALVAQALADAGLLA